MVLFAFVAGDVLNDMTLPIEFTTTKTYENNCLRGQSLPHIGYMVSRWKCAKNHNLNEIPSYKQRILGVVQRFFKGKEQIRAKFLDSLSEFRLHLNKQNRLI